MQLAESWLLRLLVAAAERHLEEHEGDGVPALLPSTTSFDSEGFGCVAFIIVCHLIPGFPVIRSHACIIWTCSGFRLHDKKQ